MATEALDIAVEEEAAPAEAPVVPLRTPEQAEVLVVALVQRHADALLRIARRYTSCQDDAHDAYQRALEQLVRHARRLEAASAHKWLFTVTRNEGLAVSKARSRYVGVEADALDAFDGRWEPSPEDVALGRDDVERAAAALGHLKADEVRALWLRADGLSYAEIQAELGWTYTKVNRCLAEGRKALLRHAAEQEAGTACAAVGPRLSAWLDGEVSGAERRTLRAHLRSCGGCRAELRALADAQRGLSVVLPGGLLATGAAGGHDHVPAFLVRLYEAVAGSVHERAVAVAQVAETASAAKLAAAVSAAAIAAGGGAVAVHEHGFTRPALPSHARGEHEHAGGAGASRAAASAAPRPPAVVVASGAGRPELRATAVGVRTATGGRVRSAAGTKAVRERRERTAQRSPARREFGSGSGGSSSSASSAGAGGAGSGGSTVVAQREFAPEPAAPAAPAPTPAPSGSVGAGAASGAGTGSGSTGSAGAAGSSPAEAEFGGP